MAKRIGTRSKQRAHNEFSVARNAVQRNVRQGRRDLRRTNRAIDASYGGAHQAIGTVGKSIVPDTKQTVKGFNQGIGQAADLLGGGGTTGAMAAQGLTAGNIVGGTISDIWRGARADQGYNRGMQESLTQEQMRMQAMARQSYQDILAEAQQSREALAQQEMARAAEIADQMRAERENRRLSNWFQNYLQKQLARQGNRQPQMGMGPLTDPYGNAIYYPGGDERAALQHGL